MPSDTPLKDALANGDEVIGDTDGPRVPTQAEVDQEERDRKTLEEISLEVWQEEMLELDESITARMIEDIFDYTTGATSSMPQEVIDLMAARKLKRAQKPLILQEV